MSARLRSSLPSTYSELYRVMFSHSGPVSMIILMVLSVICRFLYGGLTWLDGFIPLFAIMCRGFIEWFLHYYIWHEHPLPIIKKSLKNPIAKMHKRHHQQPNELETLLFGGKAVVTSCSILFFLIYFLFKDFGLSITIILSYLIILYIYDFFHLLAHSNIHPKMEFLESIINNHRQHHFKNENKWLTVSSTLPDKLFGTDK